MAGSLNKKVLCFVDEFGTAGQDNFYLGLVMVHARHAGTVDKKFSDLLENNANEIHAANLDDGYLQGLMGRFWDAAPKDQLLMVNQRIVTGEGEPSVIYAKAVVETV